MELMPDAVLITQCSLTGEQKYCNLVRWDGSAVWQSKYGEWN